MSAAAAGPVRDSAPPVEPLEVPEPSLVVLVGAAGAGKTTFARRHFDPGEILSSDGFRARISGNEADQAVTRTAFSLLHRELQERLAARLTAVVDATNVTAHARRSLLRVAARHGVPAIAVVLDLEPLLVLTRNATRAGRIVPQPAVEAQLRDLDRTLRRGSLETEGFASVRVLRSAGEVDLLAVKRRRAPESLPPGDGDRP